MAVQFENGDFSHLTHMTSRSGTVSTNYYELVDCFGPPVDGPDEDMDKVSCNWDILFTIPEDDGDSEEIVVTIYDWKCGSTTPRFDMDWHVGGHSRYGSRNCPHGEGLRWDRDQLLWCRRFCNLPMLNCLPTSSSMECKKLA